MPGSIQNGDDPLLRLKYYQDTGQRDEAANYEKYLRSTGQLQSRTGEPLHDYHKEYATGALARRMASSNAEEEAGQDVGSRVLGTGASLLSDVPGGEAAQAGAIKAASGLSYADALRQLREAKQSAEDIGTAAPARLLGGIVAAGVLPGSPAIAGATYGALSGLTNADPNTTMTDRLKSAAVKGTVGGVAGKVLDLGLTALAAKTPTWLGGTQTPAANVLQRQVDRQATSGPLYGQFRQLGDLGETPQLKEIMDLPVVRKAIDTVKGESPTLAKLPDTDASVLDAVYKRVGNKAFKAANGYETDEARQTLLGAIEDAAQAKGGSYVDAVGAFREPSKLINAVQQGKRTLATAGLARGPSVAQDIKASPEAFSQWLETASPRQAQAAQEGILGSLGQQPLVATKLGVLPYPTRALRAAPALLRQAAEHAQQGLSLQDILRLMGTSQAASVVP